MSSGPSFASILCLDDLLISLDMGYRLKVVDVLMEYSSKFQMLIFTHDISLYNLFSKAISRRHERKRWEQKEMYVLDNDFSSAGIPTTIIYNSESYFEKALRYYGLCEIPSCANNLRKETESILKELLPTKLKYSKIGEEYREKNLSGLIKALIPFYSMYDLPHIVTHMDWFRSRILNPMSHDDHSTPIYKQELKVCIEELSILRQLRPKSILVEKENILSQKYIMSLTNDTDSMQVEFTTEEEWDYVIHTGKRHYKNIDIHITFSSDTSRIPVGPHHKLKDIYTQLCTELGFTVYSRPDMDIIIARKSDSVMLRDL